MRYSITLLSTPYPSPVSLPNAMGGPLASSKLFRAALLSAVHFVKRARGGADGRRMLVDLEGLN